MKSYVRITIPPTADDGRGSSNEYVVDSALPGYGNDLAAMITAAVDTRPDHSGRLAELRRFLGKLEKRRARAMVTPTGAKYPTARVQYNAVSRTTDAAVIVQLRHYDQPDIARNPDEPGDE